MSRLGKVMELPDKIINEISLHYPQQKSKHNHWSKQVNQGFMQQNLNSHWSTFISCIDTHTIDYLSLASDLLDSKTEENELNSEELTKIHQQLQDLIQEITNSEILDKNFILNMTKYLNKIIQSINEYTISGVPPIIESIESSLGHAFMDETYRNQLQTTDIGHKVIQVLSSIADIITISQGLPQIGNTITQYWLTK